MDSRLPPPWPENYTPPNSSDSPARRRLLGVVVLGLGLAALASACWLFVKQRQFIAHAARAQGVVVRMVDVPGARHFAQAPGFTFTDSAGKVWKVTGPVNDDASSFRVGDAIEVLYPPEDPTHARIASFGKLWKSAIGVGLFGAIFAGLGWIVLRSQPLIVTVPIREDGWVARALLRLYPRR